MGTGQLLRPVRSLTIGRRGRRAPAPPARTLHRANEL